MTQVSPVHGEPTVLLSFLRHLKIGHKEGLQMALGLPDSNPGKCLQNPEGMTPKLGFYV